MTELALLEQKMDKRFDDLTALLSHFADSVQNKFDKIDARLNQIDARIDKIEARIDKIETRLDQIEIRLDKIEIRLDKIEQRLDDHDSHFERLITNGDGLSARIDRYEAGQVTQDHKIARLERLT